MSVIRGTGRIGDGNAAPAEGAPEAAYDGEGNPAPGEAVAAAGGAAARVPLRELMDDRLLDALLERSKDEAGGLRLTGAGSMLGSWSLRCSSGPCRPSWPRTWVRPE
jgi:hypothetical protein